MGAWDKILGVFRGKADAPVSVVQPVPEDVLDASMPSLPDKAPVGPEDVPPEGVPIAIWQAHQSRLREHAKAAGMTQVRFKRLTPEEIFERAMREREASRARSIV